MIFDFISPNECDKLSLMSGSDIQDLIILLNYYFIDYRNDLGLDKDCTFGLELEFEKAKFRQIDSFLHKSLFNEPWKIKTDLSLLWGAEINSPILHDYVEDWNNLKEICDYVCKLGIINKRCGGHIHVGSHVLAKDVKSWFNFILLWSCYENIIFRFSSGDYLISRESVLKYAKPMAIQFKEIYDLYKDKCDNTYDLSYYLTCERHKSVNFAKMFKNMNVDNSFKQDSTIEFRCPNGSLNPIIWQNNVNMFVKLLYYAKSPYFNRDLILKRMNINSFIYDLDNSYILNVYNDVFIDQALEFCDLIFNNNLDKINFLRQYFKELKVSNNSRAFAKARKFTK